MQIDFNIPVRGHYQNAAALLQAMRTAMPMYLTMSREAIRAIRSHTRQVTHWISAVMIYHFKECEYE